MPEVTNPTEVLSGARQLIADLMESYRDNRNYRGRNERERAFWSGYALGRRMAARQLAHMLGEPDPARRRP